MGESLSQICLARSGRAEHEYIRLLEFYIVALQVGPDALIVVVHRHAESLLGQLLAYYVLFQLFVDEFGVDLFAEELVLRASVFLSGLFFRDNLIA